MINRIKAIIFDDLKSEHIDLYKDISSRPYFTNAEKGFDLVISDGSDDIDNLLYENKNFDCIVTIGGPSKSYYKKLCSYNFQIRKKWTNVNEFNLDFIADSIIRVFFGNVNRENPDYEKLFSLFTCTFNTDEMELKRLYNSMCSQTYKGWNWFVLDDSTDNRVIDILESFRDYRITIIKNVTDHGSIGFNKRTIAMMCDGDYLVEVDHDDELTTDCLYCLKGAIDKYPDTDFVYSLALEDINGYPCLYGSNWGWGEGRTKKEVVKSKLVEFSASPQINPFSIRTIYGQPNHVRCWKKEFYHKIDGHNVNFGVLDDMEILIRTFLYGKMTMVDKVLYIQYEKGEREKGNGTAQSKRFGEIQRTCWHLKVLYDKKIHERIIELGYSDYAWNEATNSSDLWKNHTPGLEVMSNLFVP